MRRLRDSRFAAKLIVGATLALEAAPAVGQAIGESAQLRPSILEQTESAGAAATNDPNPRRPNEATPFFGSPPGIGAGTTGFISTGRHKKTPVPKPQRSPVGNAASAPGGTPPGAPGLRKPPQLERHGVPDVEPVPTQWPSPPFVPPTRRAVVDPSPFAPLGLRVGEFVLRPAIELTAGYDSNPPRQNAPKGAGEMIVAPELTARSDWDRHALNVDIHGTYTAFDESFSTSPSRLDRPTLDSRVSGRVDVSSADRVDLESRLLVSTDNPGSPNVQAGLAKLPIVTTLGGTFGYAHDFNRFEISTKTTVDRSVYQDSILTDGTSSSNDDRNFNQYAEILRGSYELLPGVKPFVEAALDSRVHDVEIDRTDADRDSTGRTIQAGTTFQLTGKLAGEAALGQTQREYKDPTLPNVSGLVYNASLVYAATPLTTMKLTAVSSTGELIVPGASGVLRRDFGFEIDHDFRRWLTGVVKFGYGADSYFGLERFDDRYTAGAALTYKLTRTVYLKGEFRHEWLRSTVAAANYDANIALLTVRLQR